MIIQRILLAGGLCAAAVLGACGGERAGTDDAAAGAPAGSEAGSGAGAGGAAGGGFSATQLTPDAGGQVVTVQMVTDEQGNNRFDPADFEAKRGDVIRFALKTGVHNAHFVADSNPNAQGLPTQPSDMLQLPGQTVDVKVSWGPGKYFYQCDPHALLGMVGHLTVTQ
jgi:plastocyanin